MFKFTLPSAKEQLLAPVLVGILSIILFFIGIEATANLQYQRELIAQGEFWRLFSGHLLHSNGYHLLLNLGGLALLWLVHGDHYRAKNYGLMCFYIALVCSAGIYMFHPTTIAYVGLSGILHGVFVWGAIKDIQSGLKSGYLLLLGIAIKIGYEQFIGTSQDLSELIAARVAVEAHLWGALGGLFYAAKEAMQKLRLSQQA